MYAVVVIGSRIRRSACGMNLSTFCCANACGADRIAVTTTMPIAVAIERSSKALLLIAKSPGRKVDNAATCQRIARDYATQDRRCSAMNVDARPTLVYDG